MEILPNEGKNLNIQVGNRTFSRYPIKTKLITPEDHDIAAIVKEYVAPHIKSGDIIFVSEKAVAITQGRAYDIKDIKPSVLAKWLSGFVTKTPVGIGLGSPETMQLALEEVGVARIFLAAIIGGLGKMVGIRGLFYVVAGSGARSIDGAVPYAIPPYNNYVSKGPKNASQVAKDISKKIGAPVAIVDANDLGVNILGFSGSMKSQRIDGRPFLEITEKLIVRIVKDNPLGQSNEQTPIGIIRPLP